MSNKDYSFSVMPTVSISRSRFNRKSQHKMTMNLGEINVIYCDEVLPGDTRSIDMASLVRMSQPIAPVMDNIFMDYYAFFCPCRLTWTHWKEFMGENNSGAGIPVTTYHVPYLSDLEGGTPIETGSYGDQMGLPIKAGVVEYNKISALPFRGLALIYNRWFRNENLIPPLAVDLSDNNQVIVGENSNYQYSRFAMAKVAVLKAAKFADYFTKCLPYAQKGAAVTLPLGSTAPVGFFSTGNIAPGAGTVSNVQGSSVLGQWDNLEIISGGASKGTIVADLSKATSATINDLRYAFQLQKFLEKDALYGTRYWELLASHFGVTAPDASLQDPEYLGGHRQAINIDQVLSTAGYDDTSAQEVGKPGANSVTGGKSSLFTKSFVEHGFIYIIAVARHDQTYSQGVNKMWLRQGRYDYYWPVFANLGAQEVKNIEIFAQGNNTTDKQVFGYQEYAAEYRYKPSICTGLLNPSATGSLDFWTLGNKFAALPTLGRTFIEQDRSNLARALATGATGPDFICDFYFQDIAVRPMPMYSIPGLIDHH